jgi:hypothetical protein
MKLIASIQGTVAIRVSGDEVIPERSVLQRDAVQFVGDCYNFSVRPNIAPGTPPQASQTLIFQQGKLIKDDVEYPILQLTVFGNGGAVTSKSTEISDVILDDCLRKLDEGLGYRFAQSDKTRLYLSNVAVEFDTELEEYIQAFHMIEDILNNEIPRDGAPFKTKRLAFGYGEVTQSTPLQLLDEFKNVDFLIERRAGEPYSKNRYFSSAPLRTIDHVRVLEQIEKSIGKREPRTRSKSS